MSVSSSPWRRVFLAFGRSSTEPCESFAVQVEVGEREVCA